MMRLTATALGAFLIGVLATLLLLAKHSNFDILSTYHNESYVLNATTQLLDAKNNTSLNLPKDVEVHLIRDYDGEAVVAVEFNINLVELKKISTRQEVPFKNRYWHAE